MIYHIFANRSNAGDWLSAIGIQSLIAPWRVTECLCDTPFVAGTMAVLRRAAAEDFILIGGGGLFMDYFVPFWERFEEISMRVPFVIWGVGCCDLKARSSRPPRDLISRIIRRSRHCSVRDEMTRDWLRDCVLPSSVACPALVAVEARNGRGGHLLHVDSYDAVGPSIYEQMVGIAKGFAAQSGLAYRQTNNLIPAGQRGALNRILGLYGSAEVVVSSRLHGCILALATGRPVIAVGADRKVDSFMGAVGLGDWVLPLERIDLLPERLSAVSRQAPAAEAIEEQRDQNRTLARRIRAMLPAPVAEGAK